MSFVELEEVVPWGRSLFEYVGMFGLTSEDLSGNILDCAAGPASFNAEATRRGIKVTSCDPIYRFGVEEIRNRIDATFDTLIANAAARRDEFVWRDIESPQHLGEVRMAAMQDLPRRLPARAQRGTLHHR